MSEPDAFFASPQFKETLTLLRAPPVKLPVSGDAAVLRELEAYAAARVTEAPSLIEGILTQAAGFPVAPPRMNLVLTEHEAYVDLTRGEFEATLFLFDPNDAPRAEYRTLKAGARAWADDEVDGCLWAGARVPSSLVLHAHNLVTAASAARALAKHIKELGDWSFRVERGEAREFVCDWEG